VTPCYAGVWWVLGWSTHFSFAFPLLGYNSDAHGLVADMSPTCALSPSADFFLVTVLFARAQIGGLYCADPRLCFLITGCMDCVHCVPDSYFSATKLKWLIDNVPAVRAAIDQDRCMFGTVDSWLIYVSVNEAVMRVYAYLNALTCLSLPCLSTETLRSQGSRH